MNGYLAALLVSLTFLHAGLVRYQPGQKSMLLIAVGLVGTVATLLAYAADQGLGT